MRLHVGNIGQTLADDIGILKYNLSQYGKLESNIELHQKLFADYAFAYVNMAITDEELAKLRRALHGKMLKQSKLTISVAAPDYTARSKAPVFCPPVLNPDQRKRILSAPCLPNIYWGRHRSSPRDDLKHATFRVKKGDRIVKPKCRKVKLWGIEKTPVEQLTRTFEHGEWQDSTGRIIQTVAPKFLKAEKALRESSNSDMETGFNDNSAEPVRSDLRNALTSESVFTLFGGKAEQPVDVVAQAPALTSAVVQCKHGLFFQHEDSPFLNSQSQIYKLGGSFDPDQWIEEFYAHRGELREQMTRRRREHLRYSKKKAQPSV